MDMDKGDLVVPATFKYRTHGKAMGVVIEVGKTETGQTHHVLWVDEGGSFQSWHYKDQIKLWTEDLKKEI